MSVKSKPENDKVKAAIAEIERRYEIGHAVLEKCGPSSPTGLIKEEARKHGISRDTCQKLRAMADVKTGYSRGELAKLYAKFQDAEHALTISHFVKLVSVPKGNLRTKLTDLALKNRWSSHRLQAEILAHQGRRASGGRNPTKVGVDQIEAELGRVLWSWDHWMKTNEASFTGLRPEVRAKVESLGRLVSKAQKMLQKGQTR